jgi:hypothetical protein
MKTDRADFKCSYHKKMTSMQGKAYVNQNNVAIPQCIRFSKHHQNKNFVN